MSRVSPQVLNDYMKLFKGNQQAHGCHIYGKEISKKGKREGKSWTENTQPLEKDFQSHLNGQKGLGLIPINHSNKVSFCVIDIDDYTSKTDEYVNLIYSNSMPLVPFRSKSGGLHLYIFFNVEVAATFAVDTMKKFLSTFSLPKDTEIFPKQKKLKSDEQGNWINLPYFNRGEPFAGSMKNGLESSMGDILELEPAIREIKAKQQSVDNINNFFEALPLQDAPPCLQSIYLSGETTHRNNYLFNLACYYKSKHGDDFEFKIMEANQQLNDPLPVAELNGTVAKNKSKEYTYTCSQEPICSRCNKSECSKREFGIGSEWVANLNYGSFTQYKCVPPYYEWEINNKNIRFTKEADIIMQNKFREMCMRELHILPGRLKDITWTRIVNKALSNVVIKEVDPEDDISPGAEFHMHLTEFLEKRAQALNKEQILMDRVYKDDKKGAYIFKGSDLISFLVRQKQFRYYGQTEIQAVLRDMKGTPTRYYISKDYGTVRAWLLPYKAIETFVEKKPITSFEVDFSETYDEQPY